MAETPDRKPSDRVSPQRDETGLLDVLRLLIDSRKAKTTADLIKYASQYGATDSVEKLKLLEAEGIPMELAFDFISVHLRIFAHKRNSSVVADARAKRVGIVLPVAPHLIELFVPVADVTFFEPEPVHGPVHHAETVKGVRDCRAGAQQMEVLVFEAFRDKGRLFVEVAVADTLEPKLLPQGVRLIAHLRPHGKPGDVVLEPGSAVAFI